MRISVCIASYRGAERLKRLLPTITKEADENVEVIVVDDGTPSEEDPMLTQWSPQFQFLAFYNKTNMGYAASIRRAISESTGEVILLLDDDTLVPEGLFATLRNLMLVMPGVGVLSWRSEGARQGQSRKAIPGMLQPATQLASYCFAFRRSVWDAIDGFDARFKFFCIDSDFCVRLTRIGHPCYRVWWPLVPHLEHGGYEADTVPFSRSEVAAKDLAEFRAKWGGNSPDEMERVALRELQERAT